MARMPWRKRSVRTITVARPDDAGTIDGLAYALYRPEGAAEGGVVVCHGANSQKENHLDFARACLAHGMAAVAYDMRGHGATGGALDERVVSDVATIASLLPPGPIGLRGSSMGGWLVLAAAASVGAAAVVAICPAPRRAVRRPPPSWRSAGRPATGCCGRCTPAALTSPPTQRVSTA